MWILYTHTHIHTYTYKHIHTYTYKHIHTYTYTHIHTYTHTYIYNTNIIKRFSSSYHVPHVDTVFCSPAQQQLHILRRQQRRRSDDLALVNSWTTAAVIAVGDVATAVAVAVAVAKSGCVGDVAADTAAKLQRHRAEYAVLVHA